MLKPNADEITPTHTDTHVNVGTNITKTYSSNNNADLHTNTKQNICDFATANINTNTNTLTNIGIKSARQTNK